ncbi:MAG: amidohydrolase [Longimicrobiaceae bacterium]
MERSAAGPELLVLAGRIHLLGGHPPVEAILLRGGEVAAAGTETEVRAAAAAGARTLRLADATLTPGLTDSHIHPTAWALARCRVDLASARTLDEGLARISEAAGAASGEWVQGVGWNAHRWGGFPTREALDRILPDRPALFESHDLHASWLNSEALRRSGITRETPDPAGGQIIRDPATGEPTGILLETARAIAHAQLPEPQPEEVQEALAEAQRELHRLGISGVHSVEPTGLADFEALRQDDRLRLRVLQHLPLDHLDAALDVGLRSGWRSPEAAGEHGGGWIRVGGVKMFLDGALGSRTAWLREPYEGTEDYRGIQTLPAAEFREIVRRAAAGGIAATVHAIGDAAVELALEVLGAITPPAALPHRIEHLQLCPPELWERAARSGVVASMQPVHLLSDIPAAERHWGHRRSRGAYAFAPLLRGGMTLAFGSDAPVETPDPRPGLFAATRRVTWEGEAWRDGPEGEWEWYPEHRLSAEQALRAYTEGAARAAGEAGRRGRLLPGYPADLAAWDRDPLACPPEELREMRCLLTIVGGEIVHRADEVEG